MTEMIDRVARAMCCSELAELAAENPQVWRAFRDMARAAIEAMREPTEAMVNVSAMGHGDEWRAMIDEALRDG